MNKIFTQNIHVTEGRMQVFIRNLTLPASIGVHPHEKTKQQNIILSITLTLDAQHQTHINTINDAVCYETICEKIRALLAQGHIELVETLAEKIVALCLEDTRIASIWVRVEKPDALAAAESVGVEIERFQPQPK